MLETGDWLVPHLWYAPHLDKPPMAYWAVAASMRLWGYSEWAVRAPVALAGLSGVLAAYLLASRLGGPRAGLWSALILQTSMLYFVMARMLTCDIFLTQFVAWAIYFGWRGWEAFRDTAEGPPAARALAGRRFLGWQSAAWAAMALGFLTKGPVALAIPLATGAALVLFRRRLAGRWGLMWLGTGFGLAIFSLMVMPWFILASHRMPQLLDYMVIDQALGHTLGTTIKNRQGSPLYFVVILAVGFLPWTPLLGWLWRPTHWRSLSQAQKDGWLMLSVWASFTFVLFSLTKAKLPAYILPIFPALAVLVAWRWSGAATSASRAGSGRIDPAEWVWRAVLISPLLLSAAMTLAVRFLFKVMDEAWVWPFFGVAVAGLVILLIWSRGWDRARCMRAAVVIGLANLLSVAALVPTVETRLKSNQTLKPLAAMLRVEYRPGDTVVCWGFFPQGLPFYLYPTVDSAHPLLFGGIPFHVVPFEFPGNRERFGKRVVPDEAALVRLLQGHARVLVVGFEGTFRQIESQIKPTPLRWFGAVGRWEFFANR